MSPRRNPVRGRAALLTTAVAVAAGAVNAAAGPSPTAHPVGDVIVVGAATAVVSWAAASAPSTVLAVVAAVSTVVGVWAAPPWATALLAAAMITAGWIRWRRRNLPWLRAAVAGTTVIGWGFVDLAGPFGVESAVGVGLLGALALSGVVRREHHVRRRVWAGVAGAAAVVLVGAVGAGAAAAQAVDNLRVAEAEVQAARDAISAGDLAAARVALGNVTGRLEAVTRALDRPWVQVGHAVPVVGPNLVLADTVAGAALTGARAGAIALGAVDLDRLGLVDGRIEVAAVQELQQPTAQLAAALATMRAQLDDLPDAWVLGRATDRIDAVRADLNRLEEQAAVLAAAVDLAPRLLGAQGPQRYFVAFTTPAESRGAGGFMGAFAEVVIDQGAIEVVRVEEVSVLEREGLPSGLRRLPRDHPIISNYGPYGFASGPGGTVSPQAWSNIMMPPDFPTIGSAIAELYPQSGGRAIDGVLMLDAVAVESLVDAGEPLGVPELGVTLDGAGTAAFLTRDFYAVEELIGLTDGEVIAAVAGVTLRSLFEGQRGSPVEVARRIGEWAGKGRAALWLADPAAQEVVGRVGISGALPRADGVNGFAVVLNNAAPNKVDVYLEREHRYTAVVDAVTGAVQAELRITLRNTAPTTGLPEVVGGGRWGDPPGTARLTTVVLTQLPVVAATLDGRPVELLRGTEGGWQRWLTTVVVPPGGGRAELVLQLEGRRPPGRFTLVVRPQAIGAAERVVAEVSTTDGRSLLRVDQVVDRVTRFTAG